MRKTRLAAHRGLAGKRTGCRWPLGDLRAQGKLPRLSLLQVFINKRSFLHSLRIFVSRSPPLKCSKPGKAGVKSSRAATGFAPDVPAKSYHTVRIMFPHGIQGGPCPELEAVCLMLTEGDALKSQSTNLLGPPIGNPTCNEKH